MEKHIIPLCLLAAALLAGCGGKEYTYVEDQETKPGPGLFSGEDGVFRIYEGTISNPVKSEKKSAPESKNTTETDSR